MTSLPSIKLLLGNSFDLHLPLPNIVSGFSSPKFIAKYSGTKPATFRSKNPHVDLCPDVTSRRTIRVHLALTAATNNLHERNVVQWLAGDPG